MEVTILAFGKIAEIASNHEWKMNGVKNTNEIRKQMEEKFPQLKNMSYVMAVNKKIISVNTELNENATVALLPPFSGG